MEKEKTSAEMRLSFFAYNAYNIIRAMNIVGINRLLAAM